MKYLIVIILLISTQLSAQYDDSIARHTGGVFGSYAIFLGDLGATYDNAPGIGFAYEYREVREYSFGALVSYERWSDVRNGSENFQNRNFIDNLKIGAYTKAHIEAPDGSDAYFGLGLSYNNVNYISDIRQGNNSFVRFSESDGALGVDGFFGFRTRIYNNIKADARANLGWLGMENSSFLVSFQVGVYYEF